MSRTADGATTRRERILEMLTWIQSFMPDGVNESEIQVHMSLAHGLTYERTTRYLIEMTLAGILFHEGGKVKIDVKGFSKLMAALRRQQQKDLSKVL